VKEAQDPSGRLYPGCERGSQDPSGRLYPGLIRLSGPLREAIPGLIRLSGPLREAYPGVYTPLRTLLGGIPWRI